MDLYPAQLDGFLMEIEDIDDRFENAIVRHEIPKQSGARLENMGQRARTVNIRCYFWDQGEHRTYVEHVDFIEHLKSTELSELIHPQYGSIKGMIETFSVRHDDRLRTAEVDIAFVEELRGSIDDSPYEDVEAAVEEALLASQEEQKAAFSAWLQDQLGAEALAIEGQTVDDSMGILEQFHGYSRSARGVIRNIDALVSTLEGTLLDVANPANGIISTFNYGTSLPGRVLGALSRCIERYVVLYDSVKSAPSRFLDNLNQARIQLEAATGFSTELRIGFASQAAHAIAGIYKDDESTRQQVRRSEKSASFDTLGRYIVRSDSSSILTSNELENSLASVRAMLQDCIDRDRTQASLKTMAASLLQHVSTVKLERDKIITVELDNTLPLHLVCHRYGLGYNYAERIASINGSIKNPSFTSGTVRIYGR